MHPTAARLAWLGWVAPSLLLLGPLGCNGPPTTATYPVAGRISFLRGGNLRKLADNQGAVEFEAVDRPGVRAFGTINEDGTFSLECLVDGQALKGAVAGTYRGRLNLDEGVQRWVNAKLLSFDKSGITLTVPAQGEVVIEIYR